MNKQLINGDNVIILSGMESDSVHLTVTSPPYANAIEYETHAEGTGENYRKRDEKFSYTNYLRDLSAVFSQVHRVTVAGGFCAVVISTVLDNKTHTPLPFHFVSLMESVGWKFHQDIIWHKCTAGIKRAGSFIQHPKMGYFYPNIMTEYILVFRKEGEMRRGDTQEVIIGDVFKMDVANNVWHIAPVPPKSVDHPCPFPEDLVTRLIVMYSQEDDTVLDPYMGAGTTLKVANYMNRNSIGIDILQKYVDLAEEFIKTPPDKWE